MYEEEGSIICIGSNNYKVLYQLGSGTQGTVYCAEHLSTEQYFAIKVVPYSSLAMSEITVLKSCNCPNIIKIFEAKREEKPDNKIYIVLELAELTLEKLIEGKPNKTLDEQELIKLLREVATGLSFMHNNNLIHHDIKPSNILMNLDVFKITDFGTASEGKTYHRQGTPVFMAPELVTESKSLYPHAVDIWGLAVSAFESYFGVHPIYCDMSKKGYTYYQKQLAEVEKAGFSIQELKARLTKDGKSRKVKMIESKWETTKNRGLLEYIFKHSLAINPKDRLKASQLLLLLSESSQTPLQPQTSSSNYFLNQVNYANHHFSSPPMPLPLKNNLISYPHQTYSSAFAAMVSNVNPRMLGTPVATRQTQLSVQSMVPTVVYEGMQYYQPVQQGVYYPQMGRPPGF